jgi:Undecaprenyl-phosphate glucose phosphotransferase
LAFKNELVNRPELGLRIVAWFGDGEEPGITGATADAAKWLETNRVEEIYCALAHDDPALPEWIKMAEQNVARFRYLPNLGMKNLVNADLQLLGDVPVLAARKEPMEYRHNRLIKRTFDILFSIIIILLVYPWLLPLLAIAIKLTSRGPVFFIQKRSGLNNEIFNVIKFRTMVVNADADQKQATASDARITPIGHFMRKHNLDELPQFINVLLGHMSVVGPRPHMINHTEEYRKLIDEFMVRHLIKPGITGLAQSRGLRGETQDPEMMRERVKADVYYLENWSLFLDIKIILDTVWNMLRGKAKGV